MKHLRDKTAVITGAANGIGRALALELARRGCRIAMVDIDEENMRRTAVEIENMGGNVSIHMIDVKYPHAIKQLPEAVIKFHQSVDILINNAGVSVTGDMTQQNISDIEWITDTNYLGVVYCCKFFLPYLEDAREAHIVNVASAAGLIGFRKRATYSGSKFAVIGFTEALAADLYKSSIGVSCAIVGPVNTQMMYRSRIYDEALGEKERLYLSTKGMEPRTVAKRIIRGIVRNRSFILISSESKTVYWMKRLLGWRFARLLAQYQDRLPA